MAGNVPRHVWAMCDVCHESLRVHVPAWLEWYRGGLGDGTKGVRGVYAWTAQGAVGDDREETLLDSRFLTVPEAMQFASMTEWMFNIRMLRRWTQNKPGHRRIDKSLIA